MLLLFARMSKDCNLLQLHLLTIECPEIATPQTSIKSQTIYGLHTEIKVYGFLSFMEFFEKGSHVAEFRIKSTDSFDKELDYIKK